MEKTKVKKTNTIIKVDEIVYDELKLTAKKLGITKDEAIEIAFSEFNKNRRGTHENSNRQ